jgi:hypothetical protein
MILEETQNLILGNLNYYGIDPTNNPLDMHREDIVTNSNNKLVRRKDSWKESKSLQDDPPVPPVPVPPLPEWPTLTGLNCGTPNETFADLPTWM